MRPPWYVHSSCVPVFISPSVCGVPRSPGLQPLLYHSWLCDPPVMRIKADQRFPNHLRELLQKELLGPTHRGSDLPGPGEAQPSRFRSEVPLDTLTFRVQLPRVLSTSAHFTGLVRWCVQAFSTACGHSPAYVTSMNN